MPVINNLPFESKYGFKSPSFVVDEQGNINATSITLAVSGSGGSASDFVVTENADDTGFIIAGFENASPVIFLQRTKTYFFNIDTPDLTFSFYNLSNDDFYTNGLSHSDGSRESEAKEKISGTYTFRVPVDAPPSLTYRGKNTLNEFVQGQISIGDPDGVFGEVDISSEANATDAISGALTVAGGVGIAKDLFVGGNLFVDEITLDGSGTPTLESDTNLELLANFRIIFKIDNNTIGFIDESGSSIPVNNTTIDDTVIGSVIPAAATFTSASVTELPTTGTGVANKTYVDQSSLSFSIAFGL